MDIHKNAKLTPQSRAAIVRRHGLITVGGAVAVQPGEQMVAVSMARTRAITLSVLGVTLLAGCLVIAVLPFRRRYDLPSPPSVRDTGNTG